MSALTISTEVLSVTLMGEQVQSECTCGYFVTLSTSSSLDLSVLTAPNVKGRVSSPVCQGAWSPAKLSGPETTHTQTVDSVMESYHIG